MLPACYARCPATVARPYAGICRQVRTPRRSRCGRRRCCRRPSAPRGRRGAECPLARRFRSTGSYLLQHGEFSHRLELVTVDTAPRPRRPGIALCELLRIGKAVVQRPAVGEVVDNGFADLIETDAVAPFVHALEIPALLAIKL